jgi:hypothetical protein
LLLELTRVLTAAVLAVVLPGYFWSVLVRPAAGLAERLAYSMALSMASVPVIALALARMAGTGVTFWMAIVSIVLVFASGWGALAVKGAAPGTADPLLPRPRPIRDGRALGLITAAFALALLSMAKLPVPGPVLVVIALALIAAGALAARQAGHAAKAEPVGDATEDGRGWSFPTVFRAPALAVVLGLTAFRAYFGVIWHDWPYIRGSDMFSHAVMTEQMLAHGSYSSYLIYPPGFFTLSAVVCRLCGLPPLQMFPLLAPALLVVTAMGAYALATRLWGWEVGVLAAGLSGLVLVGPYAGFAAGRYPDLVSAYFLIVMTVAALIAFYSSPTARSGVLLVPVAGSVVLYHSVASLYLAALLAIIVLVVLPYLVWRHRRRDARALLLALAGVGLLSVGYAGITYGLPRFLGGGSATATAVSIALGSQPAPVASQLLNALAPVIVWLGALGVAMLIVSIRYLRTAPQVAAAVTILLWCAMMYVGSRTALDGFPKRFQRDIGAPLSVIGALALGVVLMSLPRLRGRTAAGLASVVAVGLVSVTVLVQVVSDQVTSARPARDVLSRPLAAAGAWLARHNDGTGTIISSPYMNNGGISNRAVLAMGGYTGLQSYAPVRIRHPRSLPPAGRKPLLDSREVLTHPQSCRAASILVDNDVRYIVLYKFGQDADLAGFSTDHARYRRVLDNASVVIYQPVHRVCPG